MSEGTTTPVSRRTVAKGAAWAAPVILGANAAPAYAASGTKPSLTPGPACKQPGNSCNPIVKGYLFTFTVTNTSAKPIWLYTGSYGPTISTGGVIDLTYAGAQIGGTFYPDGTHIPVPSGATVTFLLSAGSSDSRDLVFDFTVAFDWGHEADPELDRDHVDDLLTSTVHVEGTPPCENCAPPA